MKIFKTLVLSLLFATCCFAQFQEIKSSGIGGGGSMFAPTISPFDSDEMYVACDMTQMFHTTDAGESWDILPFESLIATTRSPIQFTEDPMVMFAIHFNFKWDVYEPVKSIDGGETWQTINDPTGSEAYFLYTNPNNLDQLIVSDCCQLFFSADGGQSFTSIYNECSPMLFVAGAFWEGNNIFIGLNTGMLVSTDGGNNFSASNATGFPPGHGFASFTGSIENGVTRLFGLAVPSSQIVCYTGPWDIDGYKQIYSLDPNEGLWHNVNSGIPTSQHFLKIACGANDISTIYASGIDMNTYFPSVYKSVDGGGNWESTFLGSNNQNISTAWCGNQGDEDWWYAEKTFGLAVAPSDPDVVIFTDYGFVHRSDDGGTSWRQVYQQKTDSNAPSAPTPQDQYYQSNGLENTSSWWLTWTGLDELWASYTDIGAIRSEDGGSSWSFDFGPYDMGAGNQWNSTYCTINDHSNANIYAAVSSVHDIYQSTRLRDNPINSGDGAVLQSSDGGRSWTLVHDFNNPVVWLEQDPNEANVMYASVVNSFSGGIYKTENLFDGSQSIWTKLPDPPNTQGHPLSIRALNDGTVVVSYSAYRDSNGAFTATSGVFVMAPGDASWADVSDPGMRYWTKDLVIDHHDPEQNTWYVAVHSGWGGPPNGLGGLYRTYNRGNTWERIFDIDRVESITLHPNDPGIAYLTSEASGLHFLYDMNEQNPSIEFVDDYDFQHPMRVFYHPLDENEIWITSFGHGLKRAIAKTVATEEKSNDLSIEVYPNPVTNTLNIKELDEDNDLKIEIFDYQGRRHSSDLVHDDIDVRHLTKGLYILKWSHPNDIAKHGSLKFVKS